MLKLKKFASVLLVVLMLIASCFALVSCDESTDCVNGQRHYFSNHYGRCMHCHKKYCEAYGEHSYTNGYCEYCGESKSEAEKASAILRAEAAKEAKIKEAEGEAEAILKVQEATAQGIRMLNEAAPSDAVISLRSLEAFEKAADGKATKIIVPSNIQGIAGLATSVVETIKEPKE